MSLPIRSIDGVEDRNLALLQRSLGERQPLLEHKLQQRL